MKNKKWLFRKERLFIEKDNFNLIKIIKKN